MNDSQAARWAILHETLTYPHTATRFEVLRHLELIRQSTTPEELLTTLAGDDPRQQVTAATALGYFGSAEMAPQIAEALDGANTPVQRAILTALARLGNPDSLSTLLSFLESPDWEMRGDAVLALGRVALAQPEALAGIISALDDPEWAVRLVAVLMVGLLRCADALPKLQALLDDEQPQVRALVLRSLGWMAQTDHVPVITAALDDPEQTVRINAALALGDIGQPPVMAPLQQVLKHPDFNTRVAALQALGAIGFRQEAAVPHLLPLLEMALADREWRVRLVAVQVLFRWQVPDSLGPLLTRVQTENNSAVKRLALLSLGLLKNPQAMPALVEALSDPAAEVRRVAAKALGALQDGRAEGPLIASLEDTDINVRAEAAMALGRLGCRAAEPHLVALLSDPLADLRRAAAFALGQLPLQAESLKALVGRLADEEWAVRATTLLALGQLKAGQYRKQIYPLHEDPVTGVQWAAHWALARLEDQVPPSPREALKHGDPTLRWTGLCALLMTDVLTVAEEELPDDAQ